MIHEGADAVGELGGEHGDDLVGEVDRGAPLPGLHVQGGTHGDIVAHVGNVDPQHGTALAVPLQRHGVIQIPGVLAVNGDDELVPQVQPSRQGGGVHRLGRPGGLLQHRGRELAVDPLLEEDGLHGGLPAAVPAKDLRQGAHGGLFGGAVAGEVHRGLVPGAETGGPAYHQDGVAQLVPVGHQPGLPVVLAHRAGHRPVGALQNGNDPGLPLFTGGKGAALGPDGHGVAVPGAVFHPGRDEIVPAGPLPSGGGDKAEAPAGGVVDAGDEGIGMSVF